LECRAPHPRKSGPFRAATARNAATIPGHVSMHSAPNRRLSKNRPVISWFTGPETVSNAIRRGVASSSGRLVTMYSSDDKLKSSGMISSLTIGGVIGLVTASGITAQTLSGTQLLRSMTDNPHD
jgi:hypothetical protein